MVLNIDAPPGICIGIVNPPCTDCKTIGGKVAGVEVTIDNEVGYKKLPNHRSLSQELYSRLCSPRWSTKIFRNHLASQNGHTLA